MPPDISCGYCSTRLVRVGDADQLEQLDRPLRWPACGACRGGGGSTSAIWAPTVNSGLSDVIGSWKTIAISLPRTRASVASASRTSDWPFQRTSPPVMLPGQLDQAEQGLGRDALARPALADQAERLAAVDGEADTSRTACTVPRG